MMREEEIPSLFTVAIILIGESKGAEKAPL